MGIVFIWIYSHHYTNRNEADIYKYFDDGKVLYEVKSQSKSDFILLLSGIGPTDALSEKYLADSHFWDKSPSLPFLNDNRFIIRFNALMMFVSFGNIYTHMLVSIFLSFVGLVYLSAFFNLYLQKNNRLNLLFVFFIPSLLFWTSSVLKESFMILGIGILLYNLGNPMGFKLKSILWILLSIWLISLTKLYVLLAIIPPLFAWQWNEGKKDGKHLIRYLVINLFFFAVIVNAGHIHPSLDFSSVLSFKQAEFKCLAEWMGAQSVVYIPDLSQNFYSFIFALPYALFNVLFRPLPWDNLNALSLPAMIEIVLIITSVLITPFFLKKDWRKHLNFVLFSINFILILALLIGWTTPVMGAIVRYRIVLLPFLMALPLLLIDKDKLFNFTQFKR